MNDIVTEKMCTKCGIVKPMLDFQDSKMHKNGKHSQCRTCRIARSLLWTKNNPEKHHEYSQKYKAGGGYRRTDLYRRYGLTEADFEKMFIEQNGKCAICGLSPKEKLVIDHNHELGIVRGLLCRKCNIALGHFQDKVGNLKMAIIYLEKYDD